MNCAGEFKDLFLKSDISIYRRLKVFLEAFKEVNLFFD
jgi:hypothetical protein